MIRVGDFLAHRGTDGLDQRIAGLMTEIVINPLQRINVNTCLKWLFDNFIIGTFVAKSSEIIGQQCFSHFVRRHLVN